MSTPAQPVIKKFKVSTPWTIVLVFLAITAALTGCPAYTVWYSGMHGRAELNRATYNRQVKVQEAIAEEDAAGHLQGKDTIRAHGIARSNEIIGQSLEKNEAYLRWLWIDEINKNNNVMYVATELGMPIQEAGRRSVKIDSIVRAK